MTNTLDGAVSEEASVIRPVSVRQRGGARLSFLGGKKKPEDLPYTPGQLNGISESKSTHSQKTSHESRRRSALKTSGENERKNSVPAGARSVAMRPGVDETTSYGGQAADADSHMLNKRSGSVRKRLSLLKLGGRKGGGKGAGAMGSLDEE